MNIHPFPPKTIYLIHASTGCSCCSYENFRCGPFLSLEAAETKKSKFTAEHRLSSQFSKTGLYEISEHIAEDLGDGRYIIQDEVWGPDYDEKRD